MSLVAIAQPLRSSSSTQYHALGEKYETSDGRTFRYAKAGGSALVPGDLLQAAAVVTTHHTCAVASNASAGATSVTITLGATNTATANQYAEGWLNIQAGGGAGYLYKVKSHPQALGAASLTVTLEADEGLQSALTTTSTASLIQNPYSGVIEAAATTITGTIVGVATHAIAAEEYGWIQTHGPASVYISGTPILGSLIAGVSGSAGQVLAFTSVLPAVGYTMQAGVDEAHTVVFLTID